MLDVYSMHSAWYTAVNKTWKDCAKLSLLPLKIQFELVYRLLKWLQ